MWQIPKNPFFSFCFFLVFVHVELCRVGEIHDILRKEIRTNKIYRLYKTTRISKIKKKSLFMWDPIAFKFIWCSGSVLLLLLLLFFFISFSFLFVLFVLLIVAGVDCPLRHSAIIAAPLLSSKYIQIHTHTQLRELHGAHTISWIYTIYAGKRRWMSVSKFYKILSTAFVHAESLKTLLQW